MFRRLNQIFVSPNTASAKLFVWLTLAGTFFRLFFALKTNIWNGAAEQMAWSLALSADTGNTIVDLLSLRHPYSGSQLIFSLAALILKPFVFYIPVLSFVALICDFSIRFLQIYICEKVFSKQIAFWFAIWQICSVPLLLPFSTAFFSNFYICSLAPFLLLWINESASENKNLLATITISLAISFTSFNLALIPAWLIMMKRNDQKVKSFLQFLSWLLLFLTPIVFHLLRSVNLENFKLAAGDWTNTFETGFLNLSFFWLQSLPAALFFEPILFLPQKGEMLIAFICISSLLVVGLFNQNKMPSSHFSAWILLICFEVFYCVSDAYSAKTSHYGFFTYKHLSWFVPLLIVVLFMGLDFNKRWSNLTALAFIVICSTMSFAYTNDFSKISVPSLETSGWLLVGKFKQQISPLQKIAESQDTLQKNQLLFGYGWGIAGQRLKNLGLNDSLRIDELVLLQKQFKLSYQNQVRNGMLHAFDAGVTPVLDGNLRNVLERKSLNP